VLFLARAVWRLLEGVVQGALGPGGAGTRPQGPRAVKMARDPVCGTYVVPGKAVTLMRGGEQIFFCSDECRSKYAAGSREPGVGSQEAR
jgi:YHS domain-containing protein